MGHKAKASKTLSKCMYPVCDRVTIRKRTGQGRDGQGCFKVAAQLFVGLVLSCSLRFKRQLDKFMTEESSSQASFLSVRCVNLDAELVAFCAKVRLVSIHSLGS